MVRLSDLFIGGFGITQLFGENFRLANGNWAYVKGHMGIDFGTPYGTVLVAPSNGIVLRAGNYNDGYGNCVQVWDQEQGIAWKMGHMAFANVKVGDRVWTGRDIGRSDNTGFSTGNHLHFEMCFVDGNGMRLNTANGYNGLVNPISYLNAIRNLSAPLPDPAIEKARQEQARLEAERVAREQAVAKAKADAEAQAKANAKIKAEQDAQAEADRIAKEKADAEAKKITDILPDLTTPTNEKPVHVLDDTVTPPDALSQPKQVTIELPPVQDIKEVLGVLISRIRVFIDAFINLMRRGKE